MTKSASPSNLPNKKISFPFPAEVKTLFTHLLKNGDELRVVGGAVRDFLADQDISNYSTTDIDLACKYLPEETRDILEQNNIRTIPSGIKYGTITALINNKPFQITTLRKDVDTFGRDCEVEFTPDFFEDAARRDFTINALSVDANGNLYDYFGGIDDLKNQIVRFIGDANIRIKEDYLRILRFFRFSCSYTKSLDKSGLEACIKYKDHLNDLSKERIREEFFKMFKCQNRDNLLSVLQIMFDNGILNLIFSDLNQNRIDGVKNLFALEKILNRRFETIIFLALLSNGNSPRLNLSNQEKEYSKIILNQNFTADFTISEKNLLKLLLDFSKQELLDIYTIKFASINNFENLIDDFLRISKIVLMAQIPDFPINGHDLINLKIKPQNIGKVLKIAQEYWWENDFAVSKEEILSFISKNND